MRLFSPILLDWRFRQVILLAADDAIRMAKQTKQHGCGHAGTLSEGDSLIGDMWACWSGKEAGNVTIRSELFIAIVRPFHSPPNCGSAHPDSLGLLFSCSGDASSEDANFEIRNSNFKFRISNVRAVNRELPTHRRLPSTSDHYELHYAIMNASRSTINTSPPLQIPRHYLSVVFAQQVATACAGRPAHTWALIIRP